MTDNSLLQYEDLLHSIISEAQKYNVDYAEARFHSTKHLAAILQNGDSKPTISYEKQGIGIRMIYDGVMVFASTNMFDNSLNELIENTISRAKSSKKISKSPIIFSEEKSIKKNWSAIEKENLENVHVNDMISVLNEVDNYITSYDSDVILTNRSLGLDNSIEEKFYVNTDGTRLLSRVPRVSFHSLITAKYDGQLSAFSIPAGYAGLGRSGGWEIIETFDLSNYIPEQLNTSSDSIKAKPEKFEEPVDVVVGPDIAGLVAHESCGHPFEADRILGREAAQAGESYLDFDCIGTRIGSDEVCVSDDPTLPQSMGFYLYDDEGVESKKRELITDCVITDLLHNRETSSKMNIHSNAASRSVEFDKEPIIRMSNTFIEPGNFELDELLSDIKNGVYIKNFMEWNIDDRRENQRYVGFEAYRIINGELDAHVKSPVLELTSKKFWSSVDARSKNLDFKAANCGKGEPMQGAPVWTGAPDVRLRNLRVGTRS